MKKVLKVLGICLLVFLVLAGIIGVMVFNLLKNGGAAALQASEEEVQAAAEQLGDNIMDGGFWFDGKAYQLPVTIADLSEGGWVFDDALKEELGDFPANTVTNNINIDNANDTQKALSIVLINPYTETKPLEEVNIAQLSIGKFTANEVVLPQGITWKSTMADVEAAYGAPADKSKAGTELTMVYENETWKITLYFGSEENGTMSSVNYRLKY